MMHCSNLQSALIVVLLFIGVKVSTKEDFCSAKGDSCSKDKSQTSSNNDEHPAESQEEETISSTGMEWFSHGVNNNDLVTQLRNGRIIKSDGVEEAMRKVDRGNYCTNRPYQDSPQYIGYGITISAPHMHAHALEMLKDELVEGATVLDVGSGSGYLTAAMAIMVGKTGKVVGIDHIPELVDLSRENIKKGNADLLEDKRVILVLGDGREGHAQEGPYDAIHVGAAAHPIPEPLLQQLKPGGRLFIPVGPQLGDQYLEQIDKNHDGTITRKRLMGVRYVPLTSKEKQLSK
ncbi:protein-L-isoaspartate(D-aspartate) O-methyltransferase [Exaiptasia diaphana]|uniref:Protein-L-isoaspartate(D-aspartate) O-methyltransferase n=1 Tax=Exaiptasia diaphana TaxID=2652724 RepID=A0A913XTX1_EXADI|nr:protein-L-isoaspartate(D-aspartate) O-methyltransferase [Exaiptasia diaphana]KXJ09381.1 Protein-L-isoaspartate(D-aspartate) O-methyltransferase [Exaiptasia diaphana]